MRHDSGMDNLRQAVERLLNEWSAEKGSNTPDMILAEFLLSSLAAFDHAVKQREAWYGRSAKYGGIGEDDVIAERPPELPGVVPVARAAFDHEQAKESK